MHKRDWIAVSLWLGIAAGLWIIAWIISAAIPVFSNLLSLIVCLDSGESVVLC
jgi:L-lactate permease